MSLKRAAIYIWVLPTSSLGLLALALGAMQSRVRTRIVDGVLEIHGGWISFFLSRCTLLSGGAMAMTLGHVVLGRTRAALDSTRAHERVHVRQCERWGPLFIPAYLGASAWLWMCGRNPYRDNPFEREAYGHDMEF